MCQKYFNQQDSKQIEERAKGQSKPSYPAIIIGSSKMYMKKSPKLFLASIAAGVAMIGTNAWAAEKAQQKDADIAAFEKNFAEHYKGTKVDSVEKTPLPGIYQVTMGKGVAYIDSSARYFIFGRLFDMEKQEDLTDPVLAKLNRIDWDALPKETAIKMTKGDGSRVFAVFSDPLCPYCKNLEEEIAKLDNYTIYLFLNPIESLHPGAGELTRNLWCSQDKAKAWHDFMLEGKHPEKADEKCDFPQEKMLEVSANTGIMGTPTMIREDGDIVSGYLTVENLNNWLDLAAKDDQKAEGKKAKGKKEEAQNKPAAKAKGSKE